MTATYELKPKRISALDLLHARVYPLVSRFRRRSWRPTHTFCNLRPLQLRDQRLVSCRHHCKSSLLSGRWYPKLSKRLADSSIAYRRKTFSILHHEAHTAIMAHESVWYSRPRGYGKGARSWYDSFHLCFSPLPPHTQLVALASSPKRLRFQSPEARA